MSNGFSRHTPASADYRPQLTEAVPIRPRTAAREPIPATVPPDIAADYAEAAVVLHDSAKASAALSRRCLQAILRSAAGAKPSNLAAEIQEIIDSRSIPTRVVEALDAVRHIGNFAAHPTKSKTTGEIVDVEVGEAEWNLDVIESLFDFYYAQPAVLQAKKEALNKKLEAAGKPTMK